MTAWPPKHLEHIRNRYAEWDALYAGDRNRLEATGSALGQVDQGTGVAGTLGRVWRRFWGRAPMDRSTDAVIKVHVPLPADIARASRALLFAEPPSITADRPDTPEGFVTGTAPTGEYAADLAIAAATTDRLDEYLDAGLIGVCAGAAEVCAAMGGVFLRAVAKGAGDTSGRVFATRVDVDSAIPEFEWGTLARVTFWQQLPQAPNAGKSTVHRWFEIHETTPGEYMGEPADIGIVRHQLWQGTASDLGELVDLMSHPFTERFIPDLDPELGDAITTRTPGLDVVYIPNVTPNPLWRTDPTGRDLGAPDVAGAEDLCDQLDRTRSSLLEEQDLAKARITIPEAWLEANGPGQGLAFSNDRRIFTTLNMPPTEANARAEMFQPAIRVDEHLRVEQQLVEDILRRCGYSASTFGEDEDAAVTATGVNAKKDRTRLTRAEKIRHWAPALRDLLEKMLSMDVAFGWADPLVEPSIVSVVFPEAQQTPLDLAATVAAWNAAAAASLWTKVATIHPDWDDTQIRIEIDRIREDLGLTNPVLPDPTELGRNGDGLAPTATMTPDEIASAANAMGQLIRAGVDSDDAAARVGLAGLEFTGAMPTSLRLPEREASGLEPA